MWVGLFNDLFIQRCHFYKEVDTIYCWCVKELKTLERSVEINIYTHSESRTVLNLITDIEIRAMGVYSQNNINVENVSKKLKIIFRLIKEIIKCK